MERHMEHEFGLRALPCFPDENPRGHTPLDSAAAADGAEGGGA